MNAYWGKTNKKHKSCDLNNAEQRKRGSTKTDVSSWDLSQPIRMVLGMSQTPPRAKMIGSLTTNQRNDKVQLRLFDMKGS